MAACVVTALQSGSSPLPYYSCSPAQRPMNFLHSNLHLGVYFMGNGVYDSIQGQLDSKSVLFH